MCRNQAVVYQKAVFISDEPFAVGYVKKSAISTIWVFMPEWQMQAKEHYGGVLNFYTMNIVERLLYEKD